MIAPCLLLGLLALQPDSTGLQRPRGVSAALELSSGAFSVELQSDLDALLLGVSPSSSPQQRVAAMERLRGEQIGVELERLRRYLLRRVRVRFDGAAARLEVELPGLRLTPDAEGILTVGNSAVFRGVFPLQAKEVSFFASRSFGSVTLTVASATEGRRQILEPGERSAPFPIR